MNEPTHIDMHHWPKTRDYHNEIRAERDRLRASLEVAKAALERIVSRCCWLDSSVEDDCYEDDIRVGDGREARKAIAAIQEALGTAAQEGESNGPVIFVSSTPERSK